MGSYIHNGSFIRQPVDRGLIKGEDIIQVGLRGIGPPGYDLKWMTDPKATAFVKKHRRLQLAVKRKNENA